MSGAEDLVGDSLIGCVWREAALRAEGKPGKGTETGVSKASQGSWKRVRVAGVQEGLVGRELKAEAHGPYEGVGV